MLQTNALEYEAGRETVDYDRFLSLHYYLGLIKRRYLYFLIPFLLIAPVGAAVVMWLPALYVSEGRILVESQRIPTELVRPTVTSVAAERIQIMQQRLMTRDNMMAVIEKHKLFANRRSVLSTTELVDLMRERTRIVPQELGRRSGDRVTMALTVGFEYEQPDVAAKVAGELITLILNEDLRNRTSRATETTQFLAREANRLQTDLRAVEVQVAELRRTRAETSQAAMREQQSLLEQMNSQIAALKTERLRRANQSSWNNPEVQALHRRITALERSAAAPPVSTATPEAADPAFEVLETQQTSIQKSLDAVSEKLAAARMGEALERDQQAEKFEVIEQPAAPQEPTKPKRAKLLALVLALALFAGGGLAFATEMFDTTIRSRADLMRMVDGHLIVPLPYIENQRDRFWRRAKLARTALIVGLAIASALVTAYLFLPPLDLLWEQAAIRLPRYLNR